MFFASSDVLWDGKSRRLYKETDECAPLSIYGTTKLAGEETVLRNGAGTAGRLSLLYGYPLCSRATSFTAVLDALSTTRPLHMVVDEFRTPVWLPDAAAR